MAIKPFPKRTYPHPLAFAVEVVALLPRLHWSLMLLFGFGLSVAFRERLMLVVSGVNQCRYCLYGHRQLALMRGMAVGEITALLQGDWQSVPAEQSAALLYARHWAEQDGEIDETWRGWLLQQYDKRQVHLIDTALRLIRVGNLSGNSFDAILYYLSRGRLGLQNTSLE